MSEFSVGLVEFDADLVGLVAEQDAGEDRLVELFTDGFVGGLVGGAAVLE